MIGIYKITNCITGDFYIGASRNLEKRGRQHFFNSCVGHTPQFKADIRRYGRDNFKIEVIEECEASALNEREQHYLRIFQPPYNAVWKGCKRGGNFQKKVRQATKKWWDELPESTKEKIIRNNLKGPELGTRSRQRPGRKSAGL